jgi:hypothetical protein
VGTVWLRQLLVGLRKNCWWCFYQWHRIPCVPNTTFCGWKYCWKIKIQIGAAIEDLETPPEDMSVQGGIYRKPKQVDVSYREIAKH